MHRAFLALALLVAALLLATAILGALGARWQTPHARLGVAAVIATTTLHTLAYAYFLGSYRWIESTRNTKGLPSWTAGLADRNLRRVQPFLIVSTLLVATTAALGLAAREGAPSGLGHLAAATAAIAFTLGTLGLSFLAIANQSRLIAEIRKHLSTTPAPPSHPK